MPVDEQEGIIEEAETVYLDKETKGQINYAFLIVNHMSSLGMIIEEASREYSTKYVRMAVLKMKYLSSLLAPYNKRWYREKEAEHIRKINELGRQGAWDTKEGRALILNEVISWNSDFMQNLKDAGILFKSTIAVIG